MKYPTKNQLLEFMGKFKESPKDSTQTKKAPGALDLFELVHNHNEDCWVQRTVEQHSEPTVILCGPYLFNYKETKRLRIVDLLLHHGFKVLLWQGEDVSIENMLVCDKLTTLIEQHHTWQLADANKVNEYLLRNHSEPKDYFVIDYLVERALINHGNTKIWSLPLDKNGNLSAQELAAAFGENYRRQQITFEMKRRTGQLEQWIAAFPLITNLNIKGLTNLSDLQKTLATLTVLDKLTLEKPSADVFKFFDKLPTNRVRELKILNIDYDLAVNLKAFPYCEEVCITGGKCASAYNKGRLKTLRFLNTEPNQNNDLPILWDMARYEPEDDDIQEILDDLSEDKKLDLRVTSKIQQEVLAGFLMTHPLNFLKLRGNGSEIQPSLIEAIENQKQLYSLEIDGFTNVNLAIVDFQRLSSLSLYLDLEGNLDLYGNTNNKVNLENLPQLHFLELENFFVEDFSKLNAPELIHLKILSSRDDTLFLPKLPYLIFLLIRTNRGKIVFDQSHSPYLLHLDLTDSDQNNLQASEHTSTFNIISENSSFTIDHKTAGNKEQEFNNSISCIILDSQNNSVDIAYIRHCSLPVLTYDKNSKAITMRPYAFNYVVQDPILDPESADKLTVHLRVNWKHGGYIQVPTVRQYQTVTHISVDNGPLYYLYESNNKVWHLFPTPESLQTTQTFTIHLNKTNHRPYVFFEQNNLVDLEMALKEFIRAECPELHFLLDETFSPTSRLHRLNEYFVDFTDDKLEKTPENSFDTVCAILREKKGLCRHIAFVHTVLVKSILKFHAQFTKNEWHAFTDLANFDADHVNFIWHSLEVSGYGNRINPDVRLAEHHQDFFNEITAKLQPEKLIAPISTTVDPLLEQYLNLFSAITRQVQFKNVATLLNAAKQNNILIVMRESQQPVVLNHAISSYLRENHYSFDQYLYIDNPKDFSAYFTSRTITGDRVLTRSGPLQQLIQTESLIVVDWSLFTDTQLLEYLSLLETQNATLNGMQRSATCRIVGITTKPENLCETFIKRCTLALLDEDFYTQFAELPEFLNEYDDNADHVVVNCFADPVWQSTVLLQLQCNAGKLELVRSPIDVANAANTQLVVFDPPHTSSWQRFLQRAAIEKRLFINGRFIETPQLSIVTLNNMRAELPGNLMITAADTIENFDQHSFLVNSQTVDQLFTTVTTDDNNLLTTTPGLLANGEITQLFLTDSLARYAVNRLKSVVQLMSSIVQVVVLPGGQFGDFITNQTKRARVPYQELPQSNIIATDNPHETAKHLHLTLKAQNKSVLRIYVNLYTTYSELISDIQAKIIDEQCYVQERCRTTIAALMNEQIVLLIGALSPELFLQIQSALIEPAHLWLNRQRIDFSGKLIVITANESALHPYPHRSIPQFVPTIVHNVDDDNDAQHLVQRHPGVLFSQPVSVLYGEPGVGKTHQLNNLKSRTDIRTFYGYDEIVPWLTAPTHDNIPNYFIPDEMNAYPVGTWDFLYGLLDGSGVLFFKGNWYPVSVETHKVIGTMNPNHHPGRFVHRFIEEKAVKIVISHPSANQLYQDVALPILQEPQLAKLAVGTHQLAREASPETGFSVRDLKAFCFRLLLQDGLSLFQKANLQYALPINKVADRALFLQQLESALQTQSSEQMKVPQRIGEIIITESRVLLVLLVLTNLQLRFSSANLKCHVLLEGPSGTGKSSLFAALLEYAGLSPTHADPRMRFDIVNARAQNCKAMLTTAAAQGSAVILEEANGCICPNTLSDLEDGYGVTPGFILLKSQNNIAKGRKPTCQAISSRGHRAYIDKLTKDELNECAEAFNLPTAYVEAYQRVHTQYPYAVNERTFFATARQIGKLREQEPLADRENSVVQAI